MYDQREIDLESYFPDYLKNIYEFKKIAEPETTEIKKLFENCMDIWNDGFILTAGIQGLKKWESLLGTKPDSKFTLEERRAAVLANWGKQLPYTERKLREQLTAMLGNDYELYIWNQIYVLKLVVKERPQAIVKSIRNMVREMMPANLDVVFFSKYQGEFIIQVSNRNAIRFRAGFYPRYNLPQLQLDNIWVLDGSRNLNGYNSGELIDFYPVEFKFRAEVPETVRRAGEIRVSMEAMEQIDLSAEEFRLGTGVKENIQNAEGIFLVSEAKEHTAAGPVHVMNRNVMDNTWELGGGRLLNGGLSII